MLDIFSFLLLACLIIQFSCLTHSGLLLPGFVFSARGRLRVHKLENVNKALNFLKNKKVRKQERRNVPTKFGASIHVCGSFFCQEGWERIVHVSVTIGFP